MHPLLYITSDLHAGEYWGALSDFTGEESDTVILLGDTGVFWDDSEESQAFFETLCAKNCRFLCIDGNHENFARLGEFPEEPFCGGMARKISENIYYLSRGHLFTIAGKQFFVMGGGRSGEKSRQSGPWWPEEYPSDEEFSRAYGILETAKPDYILSHIYFLPQHREGKDFSLLPACSLERLFDFIDENVPFTHWYFGHWHIDRELDEKHTAVFQRLLPIA